MIISWNTTNKCNMYCEHCYRDAGNKESSELTTKEGKVLLEEIAKAGFKIMIFSGGEPLMREDIFELISYASSLGLRPVLGSNGTLISSSTAVRLKKAGITTVGISLDSLNAEKHDRFRNCNGAWRDTIYGMKNCREMGIPFQIHTTVMDWNKDELLHITDFASTMGAIAHHAFFLVPTGRGENIEREVLNLEDYEGLLKAIMEKQKQVDIELKPTCAPQFIRIAEGMGMKLRFSRGCLAGINYCIISPKGDVQPCAYLKETVGNVRKMSFGEIWAQSRIFKELRTLNYKGSCGVCKHKNICGGCRARAAYYNDGDYMSEDNLCIYSRKNNR